jgi:hypothetical protein
MLHIGRRIVLGSRRPAVDRGAQRLDVVALLIVDQDAHQGPNASLRLVEDKEA